MNVAGLTDEQLEKALKKLVKQWPKGSDPAILNLALAILAVRSIEVSNG